MKPKKVIIKVEAKLKETKDAYVFEFPDLANKKVKLEIKW